MTKLRLHSLVLITLFLFLSCITVVQAVGWVEISDAPCPGGYGEAAFYMFDRSDESDPPAHIVINEIEQNPAGFDDGYEWVELYNPTTSDVNLDGWKLSTTHGKTVTVTLHETIPANGYFVYTHAKQWLDNEDESVTLRDPQLNEIDRTPYLTEPYRVDNGYYSWQRYPNGNDTDTGSDWMFRALTKGHGSCGELPPETIYVDDDFVDDPPNHKWNTIQEGIDDASDGATIIVSDGIYNENVDVGKCLTIRSENGADATIVQAASSSDHVFEVTADWVTISGFTVMGATYGDGIYLRNVNHCSISDNHASNNECGIDLSSSSGNVLTSNSADENSDDGIRVSGSDKNDYNNSIDTTNTVNDRPVYYFFNKNGVVLNELDAGHLTLAYCSECTIKNNNVSNGDGIWLSHSSNNTLTSNTANSNSNYGIYISFSSNNTLTSNLMSDNRYNFGISGWNDSYFDNTIDTTNRVNGKPVHYIQDADGLTFDCDTHADAGTIYCIRCNNITIQDIILTDDGAGVVFWKTNNSRVENVNASNNSDGISMLYSSNNTIIANTCSNNDDGGICMLYSGNNTLKNNNASNKMGHLLVSFEQQHPHK
uniref:LTD domain-containing protein n=1 Tax=Candidatus Methanogaster sp. ANME-2c ERB4 TaxID=2759911 RepID=A0A7G9YDN8_9EURY|nr:hypothetical protein MFHEKKGA_00015 [Methanosarcinales archaeon ANME-2c ERB4]